MESRKIRSLVFKITIIHGKEVDFSRVIQMCCRGFLRLAYDFLFPSSSTFFFTYSWEISHFRFHHFSFLSYSSFRQVWINKFFSWNLFLCIFLNHFLDKKSWLRKIGLYISPNRDSEIFICSVIEFISGSFSKWIALELNDLL